MAGWGSGFVDVVIPFGFWNCSLIGGIAAFITTQLKWLLFKQALYVSELMTSISMQCNHIGTSGVSFLHVLQDPRVSSLKDPITLIYDPRVTVILSKTSYSHDHNPFYHRVIFLWSVGRVLKLALISTVTARKFRPNRSGCKPLSQWIEPPDGTTKSQINSYREQAATIMESKHKLQT